MRIRKTAARAMIVTAGITALAVPASVAAAAAPQTDATPTIVKTGDFAGYAATPSSGTLKGQATFKVPKITCTSVNAGFHEQVSLTGPAGVDTEAGEQQYCVSGQLTQDVFFIANGTDTISSLTIQPGNTITASASENEAETTVTVKDLTTGKSDGVSGPGGIGVTQVQVGAQKFEPSIPSFKPIPVTNVTISGKSLESVNPVEIGMYLGATGATAEMVPGPISDDTNFTLVFKHS
jgi:hypothetical protein